MSLKLGCAVAAKLWARQLNRLLGIVGLQLVRRRSLELLNEEGQGKLEAAAADYERERARVRELEQRLAEEARRESPTAAAECEQSRAYNKAPEPPLAAPAPGPESERAGAVAARGHAVTSFDESLSRLAQIRPPIDYDQVIADAAVVLTSP